MPGFVVPLCFVCGVTLIAAGLPLYLRRIPPNAWYGARFPSILADHDAWYEINARAGRDFMVIGAIYLVVLIVSLAAGHSWPDPFPVLVPLAVLVIGLMLETAALSRAAARLAVEQRAFPDV